MHHFLSQFLLRHPIITCLVNFNIKHILRYIPVDENEFAQELIDEEKRMREKANKHRRKNSGEVNEALEINSPPAYEVVHRKNSKSSAAVEWETQTAL